MAAPFSGKPLKPDADDPRKRFEEEYARFALVGHSLSILYPPSLLTSRSTAATKEAAADVQNGRLPPGIVNGIRMPSTIFRRHADIAAVQFSTSFGNTCHFVVIVFSGNVAKQREMQRCHEVSVEIEHLIEGYTPSQTDCVSIFGPILLHNADIFSVGLMTLPLIFRELDPLRIWCYDNVFCDTRIED